MKTRSNLYVGALALVAMLLAAVPASSQTCGGLASFQPAPFRVSGGGEFSDNTMGFTGAFAYGRNDFFGGLGLGIIDYDQMDGSSFVVAADAGYEASLDKRELAYLCPVAGFALGFGPNDIMDTGVDYGVTNFAFGLSFGINAGGTEQMRIVPTAGFGFNVANWHLSDDAGNSIDDTETYGLLEFGVGLIFNQTISVRPSLNIPVGLENSDVSFGLLTALNFGRVR